MAKNHDYVLIFLDIGLPGIKGIETALRISMLKNHLKTRLVAVTAQQACFSAGIKKLLHKPVDIKALESVIFELKG